MNNYELYHHGRKGQQWGITNGPPYPLDTTSKGYHIKQAANKLKQFAHDRFSEYGKDHQAVRDRYVSEYKNKGYNETASQILAEQKYMAMDRALIKGVSVALGTLLVGSIGTIGVGKIIQAGGSSFIKTIAGKAATEAMSGLMSNIDINQIMSSAVVSKITRNTR